MGKYIIELEDKPFHKEDGDFLYRVKGFNSLVFDMTGISKLTPYTEPGLEQVKRDYDAWYEKGLADAWEAARKICGSVTAGGLNYNTLNALFGSRYPEHIVDTFTASEVIERLNAFEQEELGIQKYFKNGEEVIDADGTKAVVLSVSEDNFCQVYTEKGCIENWHIHTYKFHKTGRYFPEIAAVLEKMRGEQDG